MDQFVSSTSKNLFSRLKIKTDFLQESVSRWKDHEDYIQAKRKVYQLKAVNDTAERGVRLMQDFHGKLTANEDQKQYVLRCVQEHRNLYPDCKKDTLKRKHPG